MLPYEKEDLRASFNADKYHLVVALNIIMYLQRKGILNIDNQGSQGKKFDWNIEKVNYMINTMVKQTYDTLSQNQYIARKKMQNNNDEYF